MVHWPIPTPGDIVWCHFPNLPRRSPGPKPRPALVCEVTEREDGVSVTVACGTSQEMDRLHAGEFAIIRQGNPAAYGSTGLSFDTKFDLRQTVELPWSEDFFSVPARARHGQHPKLGNLHASMMRAAQAAFQAVKARGRSSVKPENTPIPAARAPMTHLTSQFSGRIR